MGLNEFYLFSTNIFNRYLFNVKSLFVDNWKAEPTAFSTEKISISLKQLSGQFYGQSFISTVRGAFNSAFKINVIAKTMSHLSGYTTVVLQ